MPGGWGPDGKWYDELKVYDRTLRILDTGPPNGNNNGAANSSIPIDGTNEQSLLVSGGLVYVQNIGNATVYMDVKTGVNDTKWEILPRMRLGPLSAVDRLFFKGAGATTLKYIFVGGST